MQIRTAALITTVTIYVTCGVTHRAGSAPDGPASDQSFVYGNPDDTKDPLNPSNKGRDPRVVDAKRNVLWFRLKPQGAQLYYGNGQPMRTPEGEPVRASGSVRLNYGMRLERNGRTYFMAWQTNHDAPEKGSMTNATGWVAADDMTQEGAAAARAAIPHRLANISKPLARDAEGKPRTFIINGTNKQAKAAVDGEWAYIGVSNHRRDKVRNFLNLHDGSAGLQVLVNLPNVPGGGIAEDCFPDGASFMAAADANNELITQCIYVLDKQDGQHVLTFIYGKAGDTWGWVVKDWLD